MVMALGTLQLDAQEDSRGLGSQLVGLSHLGHHQAGLAVVIDVAGRCQEIDRDLIPATVLLELVPDPPAKLLANNPEALVLGSVGDHIPPVTPPGFRVVFTGKQGGDFRGALGGIRIERKECQLIGRRNLTGKIKTHPAKKLFIRNKGCRLDFFSL